MVEKQLFVVVLLREQLDDVLVDVVLDFGAQPDGAAG